MSPRPNLALRKLILPIVLASSCILPGSAQTYTNPPLSSGLLTASASERNGTFRILHGGSTSLWQRTYGPSASSSEIWLGPTGIMDRAELQIDFIGRSHVVFSSSLGIFYQLSEFGTWLGDNVVPSAPVGRHLFSMDLDRRNEESKPVVVYAPGTVEEQRLWIAELSENNLWQRTQITPVFPGNSNLSTALVFRHSHPSLAVDDDGNPHVAYLARTTEGLLQLRYAHRRHDIWSEFVVWSQTGDPIEVHPDFFQTRKRLVSMALPDGFTPHILAFLPTEFADGNLQGTIQVFRPMQDPSQNWERSPLFSDVQVPANDVSMVPAADTAAPLAVAVSAWNPLSQSSSVVLATVGKATLQANLMFSFTVSGPVMHLQAHWAQGYPWADVQFMDLTMNGALQRRLWRSPPIGFPPDSFATCGSLPRAINAALGRSLWEPVTLQEIQTVTNLNINGSRISDLSLLSEAISLETLNASGARVQNLSPLLESPSLQWVNLSANGLDSRSDSENAAQVATLRERGINVQWPSQKMPWHWMRDPLLEDVLRREFFGPSLSRWSHATWNFVNLDNLTSIEANELGIRSLDGLNTAKNLESAVFDNNHLRDLEGLRGLPNLREVSAANRNGIPYFGGNKIRDISPLAAAKQLQIVSLESNEITDLAPLLENFASGGLIALDNNGLDLNLGSRNWQQIQILGALPSPVFVSVESQRSRWNWLLEAPLAVALRSALNIPAGVPFDPYHHYVLQTLDASNAGITSLVGLEVASHLQSLNLLGNAVRSLEPLRGLPLLSELNLVNNQVTDLSPLLEWRPSDGILNLSGNGLDFSTGSDSVADVEALDAMGIQVLRGEETQRIPWNWALDPGLERVIRQALLLEDAEEFTWEHASSLQTLQAPSMGIRSLSGLELARNLHTLNLAHNRIHDLRPLSRLWNLRELDLSCLLPGGSIGLNQVTDLSPLANLRRLEILRLDGNRVTNLEPILNSLRPFANLDLNGNGLLDVQNDSELQRLLNILQSREVFVQIGQQRSPWNWTLSPELSREIATAVGLPAGEPFTESSHYQLTSLNLENSNVNSLEGLLFTPSLAKLTLPGGFQGNVPRLTDGAGSLIVQTEASRNQEVQAASNAAQTQGFSSGRNSVLQNPNPEGLFWRDQIYDGRFGAKTMEVEDGRFRVRWSVEASQDLSQWQEIEAFDSEVVIPGKVFLRLAPKNAPEDN